MTRKNLSIVEHASYGNQIKDARDCLRDLLSVFPPSSKASRQTRRALKSIGEVRCTLDSMVCQIAPERIDPRNLAIRVYYGEGRLQATPCDIDDIATDAFAGFREQD